MRTATLILTLLALLAAGLRAAPAAVKSPAPKKPPIKAAAKRTSRPAAVKRVVRRAAAKPITPKRRPATARTGVKKAVPKRIAPAKRTVTPKKITPKRPAPKRASTPRRRVKAAPVKFTPGERTLAPISCATRQAAPDTTALCTDCPGHALSEAYALLGLKYHRGGTSQETGMDCSGFTQHVFLRSCNVELPRSASQQYQMGVPAAKVELLRGDLVFFKSRRGWHVGIYAGDGHFIHSPNRRGSVKISSLSSSYYARTYLGARRLTQNIIEPLTIDKPSMEPLPATPVLTGSDAGADDAANGNGVN